MNPMESDGTAKDPRNPQAVTIMALPVLPLGWEAMNAPTFVQTLLLALPLIIFAASFAALLKGLADKAKFEAAVSAKRPTIPLKITGSLGLAIGVAIMVVIKDGSLAQSAQYGMIAAVLSLLSFGLAPLRDKKLDTIDSRALHQMREISDNLSDRFTAMQSEIDDLALPDLSEQVADLGVAITLLRDAACDDPTRIRSLRRHLGPIFDGIEEATQRFACLYRTDQDPTALSTFSDLLCEIEDEYYDRARKFAQSGASKLDVQSGVLRQMIKRA